MTTATSDFHEDRQLDVTVGTIKRLLIMALNNYNDATKDGSFNAASYWSGYERALKHVLEAEHE